MEVIFGFFVFFFDYLKYEVEDVSGNYIFTLYFIGVN